MRKQKENKNNNDIKDIVEEILNTVFPDTNKDNHSAIIVKVVSKLKDIDKIKLTIKKDKGAYLKEASMFHRVTVDHVLDLYTCFVLIIENILSEMENKK